MDLSENAEEVFESDEDFKEECVNQNSDIDSWKKKGERNANCHLKRLCKARFSFIC